MSNTYRVPEVRLGILETRLDAQVLRKRHHNVTVNASLFHGAETTTSSLATTSAVLTSKRAKCVVQSCASQREPTCNAFCMFAVHTLLLRQQNHRPRAPPGHCEHLRFPHAISRLCVTRRTRLRQQSHRERQRTAAYSFRRLRIGHLFLFPCAYPIATCDHKTTGECESKEVDVAFSELTKNNKKIATVLKKKKKTQTNASAEVTPPKKMRKATRRRAFETSTGVLAWWIF